MYIYISGSGRVRCYMQGGVLGDNGGGDVRWALAWRTSTRGLRRDRNKYKCGGGGGGIGARSTTSGGGAGEDKGAE